MREFYIKSIMIKTDIRQFLVEIMVMSNENAIHELYEQCMTINFDETHILLEKAKTKEEKEFVRLVTDPV